MIKKTPSVAKFNGFNNLVDPVRLGLSWLQAADNVNVTASGAIERREGYAPALAGATSDGYSTLDNSRMYLVRAGNLVQVNEDMGFTTLRAGVGPAPMAWTEINRDVFYTNGAFSGILAEDGSDRPWSWPVPTAPDLVATTGMLIAGLYQVVCTFLLPDGRETGSGDVAAIQIADGQRITIENIPQVPGWMTQVYLAPANSTVFQLAFGTTATAATWNGTPDDLGIDLVTQFLDPLPAGCQHIAVWAGRLYAMQYLQQQNATVIWASEALGFHLFDLNQSFLLVPGKGEMLAATPSALLIGTDQSIHSYNGESLALLAPYGAVPGCHPAQDDDGSILFWTQRGACKAMPFANLTEKNISVAPGLRACAAIIRKNGEKQYVVALQKGGKPFNQRSNT